MALPVRRCPVYSAPMIRSVVICRRAALATGPAILLACVAGGRADAAITRPEISAAIVTTSEAETVAGSAASLAKIGRSCDVDGGIRACGRSWKQAAGYGGMYPFLAAVSVVPTAAQARTFINGDPLPAGAETISSTASTRSSFSHQGRYTPSVRIGETAGSSRQLDARLSE